MRKETITFRVESETREALDAVAAGLDRDRSYVLNEAVAAYLDAYEWQVGHIRRGLKQAEAGKFAAEREVTRAIARWRK